jgi:transketolase
VSHPSEQRLTFIAADEFRRALRAGRDSVERARILATLARINALYAIQRAGSGHIGSSLSSLDLVAWIYTKGLQTSADVYFSSKGHDVPGQYAVLTGLGVLEFEYIHRLRRLGGLPGHPDVGVPGIAANTGSLGMGIAKAHGISSARRLSGQAHRVFVLCGDGELQEGQIWEALQPCANDQLGELTVIVDHNRLQSDRTVAKTSPLGQLERKFAAFGWNVQRIDGHDMAMIDGALSDSRGPLAIIADTVKGKGVSFFESQAAKADRELFRYHSGALEPAEYDLASGELIATARELLAPLLDPELRAETVAVRPSAAAPLARSCVGAYGQSLREAGEQHSRIVVLNADLIKDCGLLEFAAAFPERFFECGIAEQSAVSRAGGLALSGWLPIVHSFAAFLVGRANEQIFNNATERRKTIYVGCLAGLLPSQPGHSHQSVRDIAALKGIPGLVLVQPGSPEEVPQLLRWAVRDADGSVYLRLSSVPVATPYPAPNAPPRPGVGQLLRTGRDGLVFGYGPVLLRELWDAAEALEREQVSISLVNQPWLNVLDREWFAAVLAEHDVVITVDDHSISGGQGEWLAAEVARLDSARRPKVHSLGVEAIPACGNGAEVLAHHGLDARGLCASIRRIVAHARVASQPTDA